MPPTMILIGVCACAGAADRSEAEIAAKTAAARILRMRRFLVTMFSSSRFLKCMAGPRVRLRGRFAADSGGHEAFGEGWSESDIWGCWAGVEQGALAVAPDYLSVSTDRMRMPASLGGRRAISR